MLVSIERFELLACQSAFKFDPVSASNFDPLGFDGPAIDDQPASFRHDGQQTVRL